MANFWLWSVQVGFGPTDWVIVNPSNPSDIHSDIPVHVGYFVDVYVSMTNRGTSPLSGLGSVDPETSSTLEFRGRLETFDYGFRDIEGLTLLSGEAILAPYSSGNSTPGTFSLEGDEGGYNAGVWIWDVADNLEVGDTRQLHLRYSVSPSIAEGTTLLFEAQTTNINAPAQRIAYAHRDPGLVQIAIQPVNPVNQPPTAPIWRAGTLATYEVTLDNSAALASLRSDSSGVTIDFATELAPGVTLVSAAGPGSITTDSFGVGKWSLGNLARTATAKLLLTYSIAPSVVHGTLFNFTVDNLRTNEGIQENWATSAYRSTLIYSEADLSVAVTADTPSVVAGSGPGNLQYTVNVHNNGPSDALNPVPGAVTLLYLEFLDTPTLPAGVTFVSAVGTGTFPTLPVNGSFPYTNQWQYGTNYWIIGELPNGQDATLKLNFTVDSTVAVASNIRLFGHNAYVYGTLGNTDDDTSIGTATVTSNVASLSIVAADARKREGHSGATQFTFTVNRIGNTSGDVSVDYAVSGSGVSAEDFGGAIPAGTVAFGDGETSKTITIDVSGDSVVEGDEGFTVTLSNPSVGAVINPAAATADGTILNDDATLAIATADASQSEGQSGHSRSRSR